MLAAQTIDVANCNITSVGRDQITAHISNVVQSDPDEGRFVDSLPHLEIGGSPDIVAFTGDVHSCLRMTTDTGS